MPTHNSRTQAAGIGKDSKRHDLDGTPGLSGDLQYGDVQKLEQGQKSVKNTVGGAQATAAASAAPSGNMSIPNPIDFAKQKVGGSLDGAGQEIIDTPDFKRWLPFLQRIASSPTSSGILQRAYVDRLSREMSRPLGGSAAVIRQRDFDQRLREFNA